MSNKRKRPGAKKPATVKKVVTNDNPFEIQEGVKLEGNRGGTSAINKMLFEKVIQLPVNKEVSVLIPKQIADNASQASNLCLNVRRIIAEDKTLPKNFAITIRTFKDAKGQYVNSRIWRVS